MNEIEQEENTQTYMSFDKLITKKAVVVLHWLLVVAFVMTGLIGSVAAADTAPSGDEPGYVIVFLLAVTAMYVLTRVLLELFVVVFKIHEELTK